MGGSSFFAMVGISVIVGDFNFIGVTILPEEANAKLIIHAAVLSFPIAFE